MAEDHLKAGRDALARGAWEEARAAFEAALETVESAAGWEGLSWAAWWEEDGDAVIEARGHAHRLHREAGDLRGVARMAIWLGNDFLEFRGAEAVAGGWLDRAARTLGELDTGPEQGWLAAMQAFGRLEDGDTVTARELAAQVREVGRSLGVVGLEVLGQATEGLALVSEGAVGEGMRGLDEAAAAALAGECEDLPCAVWTCCYVIYACERVRDYDRAAQWFAEVQQFAAKRRIRFLNGICRAHYATALTWQGRWREAEQMLTTARDELLVTRPFWAPDATVRLGDLRRRQGRLDEARELFAEVEWLALAQLGAGEVALAAGDAAEAARLAELRLRRAAPENRTERAAALDLLARALVACGDAGAARPCVKELRSVADAVATTPLRAAASLAEGLLARADGEPETARRRLEDAVELFRRSDAPLETSGARLELAAGLRELGHAEAARRAAGAAGKTLAGLGVARAAQQAPLTAREVEVLRLVSTGLGDRDIAGTLTISEHTVHRHVANVYAKLRCSTRAAAVTEASRLGLL